MSDTPPPCGCTTVGSLVARARSILRDKKVQGREQLWPDAVLTDYLNEGLALLQSLRPDSFVRTVTLTLSPGSYQTIPDDYDQLVEVMDNTDGGVTPVSYGPVSEADDNARNAIQDFNCADEPCAKASGDADAYRVSTFSRSGTDLRGFHVQPPVPAGQRPKVTARVVANPPCHYDVTACVGVPRKHEAALVDWMLHRAWSTDIESEFAFRSAAAAHDRFYLVVNSARLNEARFGSKYWLGREGDGDERANSRNIP